MKEKIEAIKQVNKVIEENYRVKRALLEEIDLSNRYICTYKRDNLLVYYKVIKKSADKEYYNAIRVSRYIDKTSELPAYTLQYNEEYLGNIEDYTEITKEEFNKLFTEALDKINNFIKEDTL